MKKYKSKFVVEFCHCDSAGIVFYPHFYTWFDQSTERMFKAMGYPYPSLPDRFGIMGFPLLETGSTYKNACKLGDELEMQSWVAEHNEKTFLVNHVLHHADGSLALEGFEKRIVVARDNTAKNGMKSTVIPADIIAKFTTT